MVITARRCALTNEGSMENRKYKFFSILFRNLHSNAKPEEDNDNNSQRVRVENTDTEPASLPKGNTRICPAIFPFTAREIHKSLRSRVQPPRRGNSRKYRIRLLSCALRCTFGGGSLKRSSSGTKDWKRPLLLLLWSFLNFQQFCFVQGVRTCSLTAVVLLLGLATIQQCNAVITIQMVFSSWFLSLSAGVDLLFGGRKRFILEHEKGI